MQKHIFSLFALILFAQISFANVITGVAAIPDGYYNNVDGKSSPTAILDALNGIISGHTVIGYDDLEPYYQQTDFYSDTLWDMYSTCRFVAGDANKPQSKVCDGWNKEHVCCQSWIGGSPMVSDLYNVYPTDARVNNLRSNYPYGEVSGSNGAGISKDDDHHALGKLGSSINSISGYTALVFEPHDNYKGDFARTFMYMVARYRSQTLNDGNGSVMFVSSKTDFTSYAKNLLMKWHRADPVSEKEIDRNQAVYGIQKNRNPFIDYPDLAEYIWGNRVGQTVDLATMTPTCDGGGQTPVTNTKYGVTWTVNGESVQVDSVAENKRPTALPAEPTSCSSESSIFVGWTDAPISGSTDDAPVVLYTKTTDIPVVTADIALYAVFAHRETVTGANVPSSENFNFSSGYTDKQDMGTVTQNNVTITFAQATSQNPPKYYTNGTAVRCYAGNTITVTAENITEIEFTFGASDSSNPITASPGTFDAGTWSGLANSVVFTIGGSSGNRRIAGIEVTMNGEGSTTVTSRYITSCQTATEINNTSAQGEEQGRLILIGGHVYILVNDQLYNTLGQKIK